MRLVRTKKVILFSQILSNCNSLVYLSTGKNEHTVHGVLNMDIMLKSMSEVILVHFQFTYFLIFERTFFCAKATWLIHYIMSM